MKVNPVHLPNFLMVFLFIISCYAIPCANAETTGKLTPKAEGVQDDEIDKPYIFDTHSGWVTLETLNNDGFKVYRKYSVSSDGFQNTLMYNCSKNDGKKLSHLTIVVPRDFPKDSESEKKLNPNTKMRIKVDESFSDVDVEYDNGEIFLDATDDNKELLHDILLADSLGISIPIGSEPFFFRFTEKVDGFFEDAFKKFDLIKKYGNMKHYNRFEMESSCKAYQSKKKK